MPRSTTSLVAIALGSLAFLAAAPAADAQVGTGTMNLHLTAPAGTTLTSTWLDTVDASVRWDQAFQEGGGTGPFAVTGLPAGNGYLASVVSIAANGDLCSGADSNFPIVTNLTTIVIVNVTCVPRSALPAPALGRFGALLGLSLASLGALALRRRTRRAA